MAMSIERYINYFLLSAPLFLLLFSPLLDLLLLLEGEGLGVGRW